MSNGYPPEQQPYYPPPQPYYPPPIFYPTRGGTNWAGIIAGLAALGIGAAAVYWMWTQGWFNGGGGSSCTKWSNQSDCENNGCYWWGVPASCHNAPEGYIDCSSLGACDIDGYRKCDTTVPSDLCECDASLNKFNLVQHNNTDCVQGNTYLKCFVDGDGQHWCYNQVGSSADLCYQNLSDWGCPCTNGGCLVQQMGTATCASDNRCIKNATGTNMILNANSWEYTYSGGIHKYIHDLEGPLVQSPYLYPFTSNTLQNCFIYLSGEIGWPGRYIWLRIDLGYNGVWTKIFENTGLWATGSRIGPDNPTSYVTQPADKIMIRYNSLTETMTQFVGEWSI